MKGYIEDEAWVSCTFDLSGTPRQLKKTVVRNVGYAPDTLDKDLLVVDDKQILTQFKCKLPAKQIGGFLALLGGIAIGAALALSGPVGWIALGALVVVAAGTAIAIACHDCTDPLKNGTWINISSTVFINKKSTLLYNYSILECSNKGGLLIASETFEEAKKISDDMKWNARMELGVQILSQATVGFILGYGSFKGGWKSWDLLNIPVGLTEYYVSDVALYDIDYEKSVLLSAGFMTLPYLIPNQSNPILGALGSNIKSPTDILTSLGAFAIDNGANAIENYLLQQPNIDKVQELVNSSNRNKSKKSIVEDRL